MCPKLKDHLQTGGTTNIIVSNIFGHHHGECLQNSMTTYDLELLKELHLNYEARIMTDLLHLKIRCKR